MNTSLQHSTQLADIARQYLPLLKKNNPVTENQWSALNAIISCRTQQYGQIYLACNECHTHASHYQSCGHRSCNSCQNHSATKWLDRQEQKLLPVNYFMATFTLPFELRALASANQSLIYSLLFQCAISTLKDFGRNEKGFHAELAMTAVLHTHTRKLDYHPHIHIVVPAGGINKNRKEWRKIKTKYLFNGFKLAMVFRARMISAIKEAGLSVPDNPRKWVVQCQHIGKGLPAIKYLSRYLYKGVISNRNIIANDGENITFQYTDSHTKKVMTRKLKGEDFIALVLQHTLPKGFRRARDYGFLHGNAKKLLILIQIVLKARLPVIVKTERPKFICKCCCSPMNIIGFSKKKRPPLNAN